MTHKRKGFTLIELLVVVLIIGILSAIAVPQYTKAVERARVTEAMTILRTLSMALDAHVLANGYTQISGTSNMWDNLETLGVSVPESKFFTYMTVNCHSEGSNYGPGCEISIIRNGSSGSYHDGPYNIHYEKQQGESGWTLSCTLNSTAGDVDRHICNMLNNLYPAS